MVNKNQFSIKNTKKILHKVGKQWVVVSAILLGLVAGGTVATQTHINAAQANHATEKVQPKQDSVVAPLQKASADNPTTKSGASNTTSSATSSASSQASQSSVASVSSSNELSQSASSKASSSNQSNGSIANTSNVTSSTSKTIDIPSMNMKTLLSVISNNRGNDSYNHLMMTLKGFIDDNSFNIHQGIQLSDASDVMNKINKDVKGLNGGPQMDTTKSLVDLVTKRVTNISNSFSKDKRSPITVSNIASYVKGAGLSNDQANNISTVANDLDKIQLNNGAKSNYRNIFNDLSNLNMSGNNQADTLHNISNNLNEITKNAGLTINNTINALVGLFTNEKSIVNRLASDEINQDASLVASDASTMPSETNQDSFAMDYYKDVINRDSNMISNYATNPNYANIGNASNAVAEASSAVNGFTSIISASDSYAITSAAISGFNDLMNIAKASNAKHFVNGAQLGEDSKDNSNTSTWIGEFNRAKQDLDAINAKGSDAAFSAVTSTVDSLSDKLYNGNINSSINTFVASASVNTSINNIINNGYLVHVNTVKKNLVKNIPAQNTRNFTTNDLLKMLTNKGTVDFGIIPSMGGLIDYNSIITTQLSYKLTSKLGANNAENLATAIRVFNTIVNNSTLSSEYDNIIDNAKHEQKLNVSELKNQMVGLGIKAVLKDNPMPSVSSDLNMQNLFNVVSDNVNNPAYKSLMTKLGGLTDSANFAKGTKFSDLYKMLTSINSDVQKLNLDNTPLKPFQKELGSITNAAQLVNSIYGTKVVDSNTINNYLSDANLPQSLVSKVNTVVQDMAKIENNPDATKAYHGVFDGLSKLTGLNNPDQAKILNNIANSLHDVVNSAQLSNDKVGKDLNKLALLANVKAYKLQGNIPAISSVINVNNLMKVISNKDNATAFNNLMDSLDSITSLDFTNGERFSNVNAKLQSVNSAVQQLSNVSSDVKSELASVASMANDANSIYRDRLVKAGSNVNNPDTIAYDVAKAGIPQTQAHDLITMVNDMASIEKDSKVNGVYHNIFTGLKSLPGQNESYQANKLDAVSKDLDIIANGLSSKDKVTDTLVKISGETENAANSLVANEISGDADLIKSDASKMPSANSLDSDAINSDKAVVNSASTMINGIPSNSDYSELGNAEKAVNSANGALQDALTTNSSAAVQSSVNSSAASIADKNIESSIASSYARSINAQISASEAYMSSSKANSEYNASVAASTAKSESIAYSLASSADQSIANSYNAMASAKAKADGDSLAKSAAQSANDSIASVNAKSVSNSVAKDNQSKADAAAQSANSSLANSYQDSVANSVSTANSKIASSAAQSADQSIANSNSLSASQSASQSYSNSMSASRSASLSQVAQDAYNNSLMNSYNSSVSASKIAASSSAAAQSRAQSMQASQSAVAQSVASAKARQASQASNKARAARTAKRNAAKRRRSVNNARKAFRRAKTRRAKRAAARRLRKARANYKRAQKAVKRTNSKPAPKPTVKKATKQVNTTRRNVNRARQAVKRARTRRAKRAAMRTLRKAQARYNTATKQLKTIRHQKAVNAAYNKLERATKHGSRRARRRARRKLSQVNNAKKAIAKLRHRRNSKRNRRALRRANAKLAKVQRAMLK